MLQNWAEDLRATQRAKRTATQYWERGKKLTDTKKKGW